MHPLVYTAGVAGIDEARLPDRFNHLPGGVVGHPVAEGSGADQATLGLIIVEVGVAAGPVSL